MADPEKLKRETQSLLSSLIISSAKGLTVRRLRKDYNDEIGEDVPFRKLGFLSFDQFLHSIPETCRLIGQGDNALVAPVITDKTKHINDMIMKQKAPKSNRSYNRPSKRSAGVYAGNFHKPLARPPPAYSLPIQLPVFSENAHKKTLPPPPEYMYEQRKKHSHIVRPNRTENRVTNDNVQKSLQPMSAPLQPVSNQQKPYDEMNTSSSNASGNTRNVTNDTCNSTPYMCDSFRDEYHEELQFSDYEDFDDFDEEFLYKSDNEEEDVACSTMNLLRITTKEEEAQLRNGVSPPTESRVNDRVKEKLQTLISEHPEGVWCSKLIKLYNERFKQKLDPLDYGFSSVIQMCDDVRDIFHILRPNRTDWKLFDKRKPIPKIETTEDFSRYLLTIPVDSACSNTEPALPENYVHNMPRFQYPEGVLHPGEEIPRQWLVGDEKEGGYIEVIVAEVYDPSKFWIQLRGDQTSVALSTVMDEMQAFYLHNAKTLRLSLLSTRIGLYCAALFMNEYHRAVIIKIYDDETMKVFYIDYGTIAEVQVRQTCFLHHDFARLPAQAIRARLANIMPVQQNTMWPREATRCMMRLIMEKDLIALISAIDYEQHILEVFLTDTSLPDVDVHINDVLINEGYAMVGKEAPLCSTSSAAVPNVHRCPTFPEIERGVYPSIGDVVRLLKLGHTYEQIFRGYFRPDSALSLHYSPVLDFNMSSRCTTSNYNYNSATDYSNVACPSYTDTNVESSNINYCTTLSNNIDQCTTNNDTRATSCNSDSVTCTNEYTQSYDNIVQQDTDTTTTDTLRNNINDTCEQTSNVEDNYINTDTDTHTEIQDVNTPVQEYNTASEESDTSERNTESHKTEPSVSKPPPGFENVQPVTNPQDNALLKMLQQSTTYPAASLLNLATLGYPLHYANAIPCAHAYNPSVLGGLGVYNSYLVGQYLQQQEYYRTAVQQCHALEQAQRLAAMQQQRQNTKYTRKSPNSTVTECKRPDVSITPDTEQSNNELSVTDNKENSNRYVVELKISDSVLHVLKLDDELYVVSQEILTNLLKTKLSLKAWLFANQLDINTFPNKLVNIMAYEHVYKQVKSFSIPGVYPPNNLGCNLRLTLLTDVVSIIRKYGPPAIMRDLLAGLENVQSPELWKSLNSTD